MLVLSEEYVENFATAFSISMILSGVVNLSFGLLASKYFEKFYVLQTSNK